MTTSITSPQGIVQAVVTFGAGGSFALTPSFPWIAGGGSGAEALESGEPQAAAPDARSRSGVLAPTLAGRDAVPGPIAGTVRMDPDSGAITSSRLASPADLEHLAAARRHDIAARRPQGSDRRRGVLAPILATQGATCRGEDNGSILATEVQLVKGHPDSRS